MKKNFTELVFILDRSGSMSGLESDTIGGYNGLLAKQKAEKGEAVVTTVLFDDKYELLHDRIDLKGVNPITEKDYFVRGSTALLDAIGKTIDKIGNAHMHTDPSQCPERTLIVVTTDGMENSSREYNFATVKKMVTRQKEKWGWEFLFLGANMDAVSTASKFGIDEDHTANFVSDTEGTPLMYASVCEAVSMMRENIPLGSDWKMKVEKDKKKRG